MLQLKIRDSEGTKGPQTLETQMVAILQIEPPPIQGLCAAGPWPRPAPPGSLHPLRLGTGREFLLPNCLFKSPQGPTAAWRSLSPLAWQDLQQICAQGTALLVGPRASSIRGAACPMRGSPTPSDSPSPSRLPQPAAMKALGGQGRAVLLQADPYVSRCLTCWSQGWHSEISSQDF